MPRLLWVPDTADLVALASSIERATSERFPEPIGLWLRFRSHPTREVLASLERVRARCREANVTVLVGGRLDLAIAAEADGIHLPSHGLSVAQARRLVGHRMLVGASCHDARELAASSEADYVTLSPVHPVPDKGEPLGWSRFAELARNACVPVLALGGIRALDVAPSLRAGAHGVAVARAIARERESACLHGFLRALEDARLP